jgi:hypothetical protein
MLHFKNLLRVIQLSILFILAGLYNSYAQKGNSGYIILSNGDTVHGTFPNYKELERNIKSIKFKAEANTESILFTPDKILGFQVDNHDSYISYIGSRLINPGSEQDVLNETGTRSGYEDRTEKVTTFLRLIASTGNCDIYILNDYKRINFFYKLKDQNPQELYYKVYLQDAGQAKQPTDKTSYVDPLRGQIDVIKDVPTFRQQLNLIFSEEIKRYNLSSTLEDVAYNEESIVRFIKKLNPRQKNNSVNLHNGFAFMVGVSANSVVYNSTDNGFKYGKFNTTYSPVVGISYTLSLNKRHSKFMFCPNLKYYSNKQSATGVAIYSPAYTISSSFKASIVNLNIDFGYNIINTSKAKLGISAGYGMLFLFSNTESMTIVNNFGSPSTSSHYEIKGQRLANVLNLQASLLIKRHYMIWSSYSSPGLTNNEELIGFQNQKTTHGTYYSNIQFGLGYKIK